MCVPKLELGNEWDRLQPLTVSAVAGLASVPECWEVDPGEVE